MEDHARDGVEHWRRHPEFDVYEVSIFGRVRNAETGHVLTPYPYTRRGYTRVLVCLPGRPVRKRRARSRGSRRVAVARLVLEAWVGPPPHPQSMALHHNGDSLRCHLDNLYWGGPDQNAADLARHKAERMAALERAADAVGLGDAYDAWNADQPASDAAAVLAGGGSDEIPF